MAALAGHVDEVLVALPAGMQLPPGVQARAIVGGRTRQESGGNGRAQTGALLRSLGDDAWSRAGRHSESGPYSAEKWLRIYSDHLEGHARQIQRNIDAWLAGATGR